MLDRAMMRRWSGSEPRPGPSGGRAKRQALLPNVIAEIGLGPWRSGSGPPSPPAKAEALPAFRRHFKHYKRRVPSPDLAAVHSLTDFTPLPLQAHSPIPDGLKTR